MHSLIYISKHFEYVDKSLKENKRKKIKRAILLSLFFHTLLFLVFSINLRNYGNKNLTPSEIYIEFAEYKPLKPSLIESLEVPSSDSNEVEDKLIKEKEEKIQEKEKVNIFKRPNNFSWRESITKKYIKEEAKILTPKFKENPSKESKVSQSNEISPQMAKYVKSLILTIRSHWQIPEDIYNRLQGYSSELEIYIDDMGFLRYRVIRPANNKIFDEYSEEALKKTFSNLPSQLAPPKEFVDFIRNGGKIVIEFKL